MDKSYKLLDELSVGVQIIDPDMQYRFVNRTLLGEVRKSREEMIGMPMERVYPGIEATEIYRAIHDVQLSGESRSVLNEFAFPDGRIALYKLELQKVSDGVIIFSQNFTGESASELLLRDAYLRWKEEAVQHRETLKKVLDSSLDGVMYFKARRNQAGTIEDFEYSFANRVACDVIGKEESEIVGKGLLEVMPGHRDIVPEYGRSLFELYKEVVETGHSKSLLFHFEADGITDWFSNKSVKLGDGFVVTFSVVTELVQKSEKLEVLNSALQEEVRKEIQKSRQKDHALIQQSKLAAMGDMLAAIAHQWRQPLHAILLGTELSREIVEENLDRLPADDVKELKEIYPVISDRIKFLSETIEDFREFYGPSAKIEEFRVLDSIESAVRFFEGQLRSRGITCRVEGDFADVTLKGNSNQFRQVLLTLLSNSMEALEEASSPEIIIRRETAKDAELLLSVQDNGSGIKPGIEDRIFEPYFSTRGPASGTGMGLYIARLIIEKMFAGTIENQPMVGGAKFLLRLPVGK